MPSPSAYNINSNNTTNILNTNASNNNINNYNIEHNNGNSTNNNISGNISKELQNINNTLPQCEDPVIEESKLLFFYFVFV